MELKKSISSKLNNSSQFRNEIDQILQLIKDKIANYQKSLVSLRDDLDKVDNLTDLERIHTNTKLYFVFNDSAEHPAYHELQEQIQLLRNDLERVQRLEISCQQSDSIASCNDVLEMISRAGRSMTFQKIISKIEEELKETKVISRAARV